MDNDRCQMAVRTSWPLRLCSQPALPSFGTLSVCGQHLQVLEREAIDHAYSNGAKRFRESLRQIVFDVEERERLARIAEAQEATKAQRIAEIKAREKFFRERESFIYYARRERYVKIGLSTNVPKRLRSLARGGTLGPSDLTLGPLDLLAQHAGDYVTEDAIHRLLAPSHVAGEWFTHDDRVQRHIQGVLDRQRSRGR